MTHCAVYTYTGRGARLLSARGHVKQRLDVDVDHILRLL